MTPWKLLGTAAALVAIGACQDANEGSARVFLKLPSSRVPVSEQKGALMTVPRRYLAREERTRGLTGIDRLRLEIERAEATPLRIELAVRDPSPSALGERRRDEALNQPPGSPKHMTIPPPDHPQEMIGYIFTNSYAGTMAYYFKTSDDGVFVDCSERPRCRGFQSWHGVLDVQYEYTRAGLDDPRPMNATVQQLLESFEVTGIARR